ncbi:MAG TPA: DUF4097 family beta strand repeat-containing protein, partial [Blastocatellia bacterium]|nr:DUF4097 family beta strand repeat-containing protein [Blastocatellia bacterium]
MATQCENCGKELFAGQRFCRYCGKPSGQFQEEHIPTQMMNPETDPRASRRQADTAPHQGSRTAPVYTPPQQGYYQPSVGGPPMPQTPAYSPPKPRSAWGWIVALVAIGLFGAMFLGFLLIGRSISNRARTRDNPPVTAVAEAGEKRLDEEGASVSSRETVITRTFQMTAASRFSINNPNGEVSIEGWDQPQAEVRVIKRGGSRTDRRNTEVYFSESDGLLKFRTAPPRGRSVEVRYEIKLPRTLKLVTLETASGSITIADLKSALSINTASGDIQLNDIIGDITLNTASGDVALSEAQGKIAINTASGSIELNDITGAVRSNAASGNIKVVFESVTPGEPLEFSTANGDVEIEFRSPINADLEI